MRPFFHPALLVLIAALAARLTAQPANVQADPTTGVLFRPTNLVTPLGNATGTLLGANGGTGVANTGKTITLGGNVTTSGAFGLTLTLTGTTGVTLPTTGTLATLAGTEAFTNKSSITAPASTDLTLSGGSSGASLVLGQSATSNATLTFKGQTGQILVYQDSTLAARAQYGPIGSSSTGTGNTAFGVAAGTSQTLGTNAYNNAFFGANAGRATTSGYQNTFVGSSAGDGNTTGHTNTGIGQGSLFTNSVDHDNVGVGFHASLNPAGGGGQNTAVGSGALQGAGGSSAGYNTAVGYQSMLLATTAAENVALGRYSLGTVTTGANNTALGNQTLYSNQTGANNVSIGYRSGYYATGSNEFYLDNQLRANNAAEKTSALFYGVFSATPASQTLAINAQVSHAFGTNLAPQTAPASPASGWTLYTDSGDGNKLKAKASTGTVVTLGTP